MEQKYNFSETSSDSVTLEDFASLLSKAVYNEPELRVFIKQEALKRVDKDNDVFYAWVKDEPVGTKTFRETIQSYDKTDILPQIENNFPSLTILVPDWRWVSDDCFSLDKWDVSVQEVGVSVPMKDGIAPIFGDGEILYYSKAGEFSTMPVLIVKENERVVALPGTKSAETEYQFIDPYYDNRSGDKSPCTKGSRQEGETHYLTTPTATYEYPYANLSRQERYAIQYQRTAANAGNSISQRDYIYYGITNGANNGSLRTQPRENIYQFKFKTANSEFFYDETTDCRLIQQWPGPTVQWDGAQLQSQLWSEGNLEIYFTVLMGPRANDQYDKKHISVSIDDAFTVKKVYETRFYNWLGVLNNRTYYVDKTCFEPKWVTVNAPLFNWDVAKYPTEYKIMVYELDGTESTKTTVSYSSSYMTNWKMDGGLSGSYSGVTIKLGANFGSSSTETQNGSFEITKSQSSDDLGTFWVYYQDNVIDGLSGSNAIMKHYSTGSVDVMIRTM